MSGDKFSGPSPNLLEAADILIRAPNLPHHLQPLTVRVFERSMTGRRVVGYLEIPVRRYSQVRAGVGNGGTPCACAPHTPGPR